MDILVIYSNEDIYSKRIKASKMDASTLAAKGKEVALEYTW